MYGLFMACSFVCPWNYDVDETRVTLEDRAYLYCKRWKTNRAVYNSYASRWVILRYRIYRMLYCGFLVTNRPIPIYRTE